MSVVHPNIKEEYEANHEVSESFSDKECTLSLLQNHDVALLIKNQKDMELQGNNPLNCPILFKVKVVSSQCAPRLPASPSLITFQFEKLVFFAFRHTGVISCVKYYTWDSYRINKQSLLLQS